ncbi:hypothetical protein [Pseudokineococcus lusitanus]|uniref:Uncharacterized protein n=1 Tax=Pseudokineococcus lusitanus TaxID=763993 RepID=A0A3N1HTV9_9ACTN|nr:hypothetical protein [Pseudokineococcus lusitanus]ROP45973.1 hypothetical protein EDC03_0589 [Pseudokineococcus lusitanus]
MTGDALEKQLQVWCPTCQELKFWHAHVPTWCANCEQLFPTRILLRRGVRDIKIHDSQAQCPDCDLYSPIIDGIYEFTSTALNLLSRPEYDLERLANVALALNAARQQRSPQAAIRTVTKTDEELGQHLKRFFEWKGAPAVIAALTLLVSVVVPLVTAYVGRTGVDEDRVHEIVEEAVQESRRQSNEPDAVTEAVVEAVRQAFAEERARSQPPRPDTPPPVAP